MIGKNAMKRSNTFSTITKADIIEIGISGEYDPEFGLVAIYTEFLIDPLYIVVFKESLEQVPMSGGFARPIQAENWLKENREDIINKDFEQKFLFNE